jgi:sulfite reductase (NADPH) hemoprotein beta-component
MRMLAHIARKYDKNYGHFTTRQNIQYNWPRLVDVPDILADLASVEMHAIQTSGNCIRNVTSDQYAGVSADEIVDSRVYAEILRQWSTFHPEFSFLPRKFKIAVTASPNDRAAVRFHDIGVIVHKNDVGEIGFEIMAGGGMGRTPVVAPTLNKFVPEGDLLAYCEAILRVYNMLGRRDNLFKARIKILVMSTGVEAFTKMVEDEFDLIKDTALRLPDEEIACIRSYFAPPPYEELPAGSRILDGYLLKEPEFADWHAVNAAAHKQPGYVIATASLKPTGGVPGDCSAEQMDAIAALAEKYSLSEVRVTHEQNLAFPYVKKDDLFAVWQEFMRIGIATPNLDLISDIIACPGLDYCGLATARSIPVAQRLSERFQDLKRQRNIGELRLNISGCINACGHHHAGNIGILGVDKQNQEFYQVTLGGHDGEDASIGEIVGPSFPVDKIVDAVETIVDVYLDQRQGGERFIDTYRRVGAKPFKERLYAAH